MLQRLLLLPLLSPLLVTLLVAALNPSPSLALRLLTWQTPSLPIGLWMVAAAGGGAALSAGATALALRQGGRPPLRRTVRRPDRLEDDTWSAPWGGRSEGRASATAPAPAAPSAAAAGPSRGPGEPAPTVSVPYRVLHRPEAAVASRPTSPAPAGAADDWGNDDGEEW